MSIDVVDLSNIKVRVISPYLFYGAIAFAAIGNILYHYWMKSRLTKYWVILSLCLVVILTTIEVISQGESIYTNVKSETTNIRPPAKCYELTHVITVNELDDIDHKVGELELYYYSDIMPIAYRINSPENLKKAFTITGELKKSRNNKKLPNDIIKIENGNQVVFSQQKNEYILTFSSKEILLVKKEPISISLFFKTRPGKNSKMQYKLKHPALDFAPRKDITFETTENDNCMCEKTI